MYYVIYTSSGMEKKTEDYIKRMIPGHLYKRCFHPVRHTLRKFQGQWKDWFDVLIPGYIFLESDDIEGFYQEVRKNTRYLNILGKSFTKDDLEFYELNASEEDWLISLTGAEPDKEAEDDPVAEISKIEFDENDEVVILSGPLKNLSGHIKKINLHKKIAEVEMEFMNRRTTIFMGIDFMEKKEKA